MKSTRHFFSFLMTIIVTTSLILGAPGCAPNASQTQVSQPAPAQTSAKSLETSPAAASAITEEASPTLSLIEATVTPAAFIYDEEKALAPRVLRQSPAGGEEMPLDGSVEITFDQPMEPKKTTAAWKMTSAEGNPVSGDITWLSNQVMRFTPSQTLQKASVYHIELSVDAASSQGISLEESYTSLLTTVGDLFVARVIPQDGAVDVENTTTITVMFNHAVVPLATVEQTQDLPSPLQITPAVEGKGEWLNTSVFVFRPDKPLKNASTFTIVVKASLQDASGVALAQDYRWQFTTVAPSIGEFLILDRTSNPENNYQDVALDQGFSITFRQPMDKSSVEEALALTSSKGEAVKLNLSWEGQDVLTLKPIENLNLGTKYTLKLEKKAKAADGGELRDGLDWTFTTYQPPAVKRTSPANGTKQKSFSNVLHIEFVSPMNLNSLKDKFVVTPPVVGTENILYSDWNWSVDIYGFKPSTNYEVRLLPGATDIYGNQITDTYSFRFTTGNRTPTAYLQMPGDIPIFNLNTTPKILYARSVNVNSLNVELFQLSLEDYTHMVLGDKERYSYTPSQENLVARWSIPAKSETNEFQSYPVELKNTDGNTLPPGFYFITLDSPQLVHEYSLYADSRLFIVADANLTLKNTYTPGNYTAREASAGKHVSETLVWMTDLTTGSPIQGSSLVVYDGFFQRIGTGVTDENGIVFLKSDESPVSEDVENPWKKNIRYVVTDGQDVHFAFASSDWGSGVSPYDFGIWSDFYSPPDNLTAYVYTDRPIYRPGQPVYFKGIVRWNDDLIYNLPQIKEVTVKINSFDETVYEESLPLNDFGSFSAKLELDKEAALGSYSIDVYLPNLKDIPTEKFRESSLGGVTFSVAEYHKPEFEVNVSTDKTDVLSGDSFIANIAAHYYSGGNVPDADVNWALTTETFSFTPPDDYIQYSFYDDEEDAGRWQEREHIYEVIAEGKGKTDVNGQLALDFKADLGKYKTSQSLTLEATLTDISGNQVSGRTLLTAHQSKQYPGIMSTEYVGKVAKPVTFQVVVLDWQGNPVPRQSVSVDFYERRWSSVQEQNPDGSIEWKTSVENNLLQRSTGLETAQDGKVSLDFIPSKGGVFKALVTTQDDQGNTNKSAAYIWVAGQEYIPWRQTNNRSFDLITDRKTYEPGDTAEILIASPFEGESYALLTVERGRVRSYEVIRLTSNSTLYHLPLTADMIPNVYISAVVIKGAPPANPQDTAPNIPDFKMGMREIKVKPEEKALTVEVTPSPSQAGPGDEVTYSLKITDKEGKPVHAEVSLALSDLSTLRLVDPNSRPILDFFYSRRDLGVTTTVPIVLSVEGYNAAIEEYITDGRGGGGGGGKGGADTLGVPKVRENFPDTAFWKGHVETDDNGVASVQVSLPDNLTTWRMDARAVTIDTRVGQNTVDIVSSKPLLIRPQTPRFFVSGDRAKVGMAVHNNTQENLDVEVALDTKGFSLLNQAKSSVQIPAASQAYVSWEGTVAPDAKWVDLVFQAKSGNYSDASRPTIGSASIGADGGEKGLPVYRYEVMETVGTAGLITDGNAPSEKVIARSESISLPVFKDTSATDIKGSLDVELSSSLAAAMLPGLDYLKHYPYECTEQTISRFLPNIFTLAMLDAAQVENEDLHANLNEQINVALQRLYKQQNPDGGWGWWGANQKSDLQTSAYVVFGMQSALGSGATVNKEVLQRAIEYLNANLVFTKDLQSRSELNTQAFVLFVLAAAQKPAVSNTVQLYEARQSLSHYGRAFLALALSIIDSQDPRLKTLQSDFTNAAILSATGAHWEETVRDYYGWNTNTRTSALVLLALLAIDPQNELNANAVRWLMSNRSDNGHWSTTQDTVWTIIALTSWSFSSKDLQAEYKYTAALNGKQLGNNEWQQAQAITSLSDASALKPYELTVDVQNMLADQLNRLTIARTQGPGTLYYTAHLNVSLPAEKVGSLNRGIIISRNYFHPNNPRLPITKVERGDTILARLTIVAPSDLHYIVIDDPLPAGLEAVDQSLLTNARATAPSTESPTRQPGEVRTWLDDVFARGWGWEFFEHVEMRDEKVVLSASYLPAGTYTYTYLVRAGSSGEFRVIPPTAREFYFPEVYGRGTGSVFQVLDK